MKKRYRMDQKRIDAVVFYLFFAYIPRSFTV